METGSNITIINDADINTSNLISEYRRLTRAYIKSRAMNYIYQYTRKAKNSVQMYHRISNSITEATHLKTVAE